MTRSVTLGAAFAALFLLPALTAKPAHAQQTFAPALIAPDVAINEDLFQHDPVLTLKDLRQEVADIENVRRMDPVRLADWRKTHCASTYFYVGARLTLEETKTLVAIYTRTNLIVAADTASNTVICERDIDAWAAASQMVAQRSRVPIVGDLRAELRDYARSAKRGGQPRIIAANVERGWTAYQLGFSHEPLSNQRGLMEDMKKDIHAGIPQPSLPPLGNTRSVAIAALTVAQWVYGDYSYCLSPRFAAERRSMMLRIVRVGNKNWETLHALNGYVPGDP